MKRRYPQIGDEVRFYMPIEGIDTGHIVSIDGAYINIRINIDGASIVIERYDTEIQPVEGAKYYEWTA